MNTLSILGYCLPAFKRIVGRMQHDLFHVYTVDQHILTVLRNMRRFVTPQHVHEYPLCSQLIAQFEPKPVLYLAALFHDIAKGRGGDHSDLGQQDLKRFGRSMNLPETDLELAMFLVKHHLTMSTVAQKSDLSDADVIARFASIVMTEHRLTALYLLTVADIRGTSPKVWNTWKAKLLENLYDQTLCYLEQAGKYSHDALHTPAHAAQDAVLALLPIGTQPKALWSTLEDAYFLRNDAHDAAWHTEVLLSRINHAITVASRLAPDNSGLQIMVYAKDQPELFARLCSCFDSLSLSVWDAQVYTTRTGYALDHFVLALPETFQPSPLNFVPPTESPTETERLQHLMRVVEHALNSTLNNRPPLPVPRSDRLPRQARYFTFEPQIHLMPDEKGSNYLLEIQAIDQASLLYRIAQVFAKYSISVHSARITTLGSRAEDFFLISGEALELPKTQLSLETALLAALQV
jgi:[protein-PII] uridylyltransferase